MDKDDVKIILSSSRPCGIDEEDPLFQQALEIASSDAELSKWLTNERSFDQEFSHHMETICVPPDLREQLLTLPDERERLRLDEALSSGFVSMEPPKNLKKDILSSMGRANEGRNRGRIIAFFTGALASAALILLGLFFFPFGPLKKGAPIITAQALTLETQQLLSSASFQLDFEGNDYLKLVSWTAEKGVPTPTLLPPKLTSLETIGCKSFSIRGKPVILVCFKSAQYGMLHLIATDLEHCATCVKNFPVLASVKRCCHRCNALGGMVAQWRNEKMAYALFSKEASLEEFQEIF